MGEDPIPNDLSATNLFNVKDKVVLITEGCSKTGVIVAAALIDNGAKVYLASKDEAALREVKEELSNRGPGRCEDICADLESKEGCIALCTTMKQHECQLHVLVNNSGATWGGLWEDFPDSSWDQDLASRVKSLLYVTGGLTDLLVANATASQPGRIINISSNILDLSDPRDESEQVLSYDTNKSAVSHLTTVLSASLSSRFVSVNAILPDIELASIMHATATRDASSDALSQYLDSANDLAGVLLFLASSAGARVTGARIESETIGAQGIIRWWGRRRMSTGGT